MTQLSSTTITSLPPLLQGLRRDIDGIDDQILDLLEQRYAIVRRVGWAKGSAAETALAIRPAREASIVDRLSARTGNVPVEDVAQIWRTILTLSARQQRPYRLLLLGPDSARAALAAAAARRHGAAATAEWSDDRASALAAARRGDAILMVSLDDELADGTGLDLIGQHPTGCAEHPWALELGRLHSDEQHRSDWSRDSWRRKTHRQAPIYPEPRVAAAVEDALAAEAPVIAANEISELRGLIDEAQRGRAVLIQAGECAEPIDAGRDEIGAMATLVDTLAQQLEDCCGLPAVRLGRIGGQFAKPRSRSSDGTGPGALSAYRGDAINGRAPCPRARRPDPHRMRSARDQARRVRDWLEGRPGPRLFTSHEALLLGYESALTREADGTAWAGSAHSLWLGERTRQCDGAHVEYLRGIANPIGIKCGPAMSPDDLRALLMRLDPERQPGRMMLVARLGHRHVAERLPALMAAVRDSGHEALWLCDPLHGNNRTANGTKLRLLPEVIAETQAFVGVARVMGIHPGGLHLEVTPRPVDECVDTLAEAGPDRRFESLCDPRLNPEQAGRVVAAFTHAMECDQ